MLNEMSREIDEDGFLDAFPVLMLALGRQWPSPSATSTD